MDRRTIDRLLGDRSQGEAVERLLDYGNDIENEERRMRFLRRGFNEVERRY